MTAESLSVLAASQDFLGELAQGPLLRKLVLGGLRFTGAQRVGVVLNESGLRVRARSSGLESVSLVNEPLESSDSLSPLLIRKAFDTGSPQYEAQGDLRRLALPLQLGARRLGVLFLEGAGRVPAFTSRRSELEVLAGQMAIALENSRKFEAHQGEDFLDLIFRHIPAGFWVVDRNLRFTRAAGQNPTLDALGPINGKTVEEVMGAVDASRAPEVLERHRRALKGEAQKYDILNLGRWVTCALDPIRNDEGEVVGAVGVSLDATDHHEALKARDRSLSLLEATIEATADGILVIDAGGRLAAFNQRFLSLWRLDPQTAVSMDDRGLLSIVREQLEDPETFLKSVVALYATSDAESLDLVRFKDGRVFERYSRPQRIRGVAVGRVWSFRDITEREALLRRAEFLAEAARCLASLDIEPALRRLAELATPYFGDGCAVDLVDDDGQWRRLSSATKRPELPMPETPSEQVRAGRLHLDESEVLPLLELPLISKDRQLGALTLRGPEHRRFSEAELEVAEELARRVSLAIDNARLFRQSQDALRARDEFLAIAAHELRGPANAIHLSVQSLKKGRLTPEAVGKLLEVLERQDRRLAQFVDELLDLGRIRGGKLRLEREQVDLRALVEEVASVLRADLQRSGSALRIEPGEPVVGHWDAFRLHQVVTNLLSNAIKFGKGQPIELTLRSRGGVAFLQLRDEGLGIEQEVLERVFNPFVRGVSVRHYGGLGLGLYIVKTLVDAHGGTIRVESTPERGTTFTVALPEALPAEFARSPDAGPPT